MMSGMNKKNFAFYLVFLLLVVFAFFLRFYRLDERVFHHDEAAVGYFTYKLFSEHTYSYDPAFHGPFMYYTTTEIFKKLGDTIYSARFLPAILGSAMLLFLLPLRKYIGNTGMLVSAFFLAVSPSFLYYSRFYREDIFMSFFSLLLLVCAVKYIENYSNDKNIVIKNQYLFSSIIIILTAVFIWIIPGLNLMLLSLLTSKGLYLVSIALIALLVIILGYGGFPLMRFVYIIFGMLALASLAALKENAYIIMALIFFFIFLLAVKEKWYDGLLGKIKHPDTKTLIVLTEMLFLIFIFLVFFSLFYTGNFLDIQGMKDAFMKAVSHWYEMHRIERMAGPFFFYLPILALYELPIFVFGLLGMAHYGCCEKKKEKILAAFLVYWSILALMYYLKDVYPGSGRFLPITYVPDAVIIFLPLLIFAVMTVLRSSNLFISFLIYWALVNFIVYSYIQEKVPWLVLNPLLPLVIIAAMYIGEILPGLKLNSRTGIIAVIFIILTSVFFIYSSIQLNYYRYADAAEPLIQAAQPPQDFSLFLDKINEISTQYEGNSTEIQLTDAELETQFLWYMRHFNNIRWRVRINSTFDAPLIVVHDTDGNESDADIVRQSLRTDYERLDSAKMSWYWFQSSDITPDYLLYRKMDREPSEYRIVLYYKPKFQRS
jgi:predicted membrane-bound mannosyltransferase